MNQATKKELKKLIGNYVWVLPTGSNKDRKINDKESIYSVRLIKITSINAYFEDQLVNKLKIDGSCDEKNHSGLIFSSKEDAMDYLWGIDFIKFLKFDFDFKTLKIEDLKKVRDMIKG